MGEAWFRGRSIAAFVLACNKMIKDLVIQARMGDEKAIKLLFGDKEFEKWRNGKD